MKVKDIIIQYRDKLVLEKINFEVKRGDVLGIIGANGVGKSTLIKVLARIINDYEGVYESDLSIGYVPQYIALYDNLSVYDNIKIFSSMSSFSNDELDKKIEEVLERLDLTINKKTKVKDLSGGNKRRVNIAVSLINEPDCLIMDEPEVGIDYKVRSELEENIKKIADEGKAVIVSSHSKEFISNISNKVLILQDNTQTYYGEAKDEVFERL